ncbi:hypothetical protein FLWE109334_12780 [Flavobacterium weaverense]
MLKKVRNLSIKKFELTSTELLKFMLLGFLIDHFDVVSANDKEEILHLSF